jgi:hypothetical protein
MVGLGSTQRYYVYQGVVDMRKSFDGLQGLGVEQDWKGMCMCFSMAVGLRLNFWCGIAVVL